MQRRRHTHGYPGGRLVETRLEGRSAPFVDPRGKVISAFGFVGKTLDIGIGQNVAALCYDRSCHDTTRM